ERRGAPVPVEDLPRRVAVIVNPTKFANLGNVHRQVTKACLDSGWDEPLWLETTPDDTGHGQTVQALEAGVDLVCPLGGDGTVREVAEVMVGSGVASGLLPGGAGNLLARALGRPIDDLGAALRVALTGRGRAVDVGRVAFDVSGEDERRRER